MSALVRKDCLSDSKILVVKNLHRQTGYLLGADSLISHKIASAMSIDHAVHATLPTFKYGKFWDDLDQCCFNDWVDHPDRCLLFIVV